MQLFIMGKLKKYIKQKVAYEVMMTQSNVTVLTQLLSDH